MNRVINEDFERVKKFFANYSLADLVQDKDFNKDIKCLHRKLYSLMVFCSEIATQNQTSKSYNDITITYIKETVSDYVLAFFCWVHGAYKPANLQLRSSIENFLKSILYESTPGIIVEKSVYKIFDTAKVDAYFTNTIGQKHFLCLSNYYSQLCQIAHGEISNLSDVDALKLFPTYNNQKSQEFLGNFLGVVEAVLAMYYFVYYKNIYGMHEFNRDLFLQGIKTENKKEIYEMKAPSGI